MSSSIVARFCLARGAARPARRRPPKRCQNLQPVHGGIM
jgi:hypothetical protein